MLMLMRSAKTMDNEKTIDNAKPDLTVNTETMENSTINLKGILFVNLMNLINMIIIKITPYFVLIYVSKDLNTYLNFYQYID